VSILHHLQDITTYFLNLKRSRDPKHIPFGGNQYIMHALVLSCVNQHTKFEVPSFTDSKAMSGAKS